jgi:hypothetical protein
VRGLVAPSSLEKTEAQVARSVDGCGLPKDYSRRALWQEMSAIAVLTQSIPMRVMSRETDAMFDR